MLDDAGHSLLALLERDDHDRGYGVNHHVFSFQAGEQVLRDEDPLSLSRRKTGSQRYAGGQTSAGLPAVVHCGGCLKAMRPHQLELYFETDPALALRQFHEQIWQDDVGPEPRHQDVTPISSTAAASLAPLRNGARR
jgi:hypothetical protein